MIEHIKRHKAIRNASKSKDLKRRIDKFFESILEPKEFNKFRFALKYSKSQARQDVIALLLNQFKIGGCYLELGAADGEYLSNTYMLHKKYQWTGILVEPNRKFFEKLVKKRSNDILDCRAIDRVSGQVISFYGTKFPELSTTKLDYQDGWKVERSANFESYNVNTVSLPDLISECNVNKSIDFLSIDIEGTELDSLENFSQIEIPIKLICIEHSNVRKKQELIYYKLNDLGYTRLNFGFNYWDDWYVIRKSEDLNQQIIQKLI